MTDYYLQDKSRLNGQPQRTIADYVESQGILVPSQLSTYFAGLRPNAETFF